MKETGITYNKENLLEDLLTRLVRLRQAIL